MVAGPATSNIALELWKMRISGTHPRPSQSESLGVGCNTLCFNKPMILSHAEVWNFCSGVTLGDKNYKLNIVLGKACKYI